MSTPHVAPVRPTALVTGASSGIGLAGVTALGADLARDGVEPGSVATGISGRRTIHSPDGSPYAAGLRQMLGRLDAAERDGVSAGRVARRFGLGPRGVRA